MSQYPPPTPGNVPPNYGQPTSFGQPGAGPYDVPAQKTSVAAIISLITGILGCFIITGLIAIITGIIGIKQTGKPGVKGRGLAITGLTLGLFFGLVGAVGVAGFYGLWKYGLAQLENGRTFTNAVIAGDYATAMQYTSMPREEVESLGEQMKDWGTITDLKLEGTRTSRGVGEPQQVVLTGSVTFSNAGQKSFELIMGESDGSLKVAGIHFK